jgi:hypothetical protein
MVLSLLSDIILEEDIEGGGEVAGIADCLPYITIEGIAIIIVIILDEFTTAPSPTILLTYVLCKFRNNHSLNR